MTATTSSKTTRATALGLVSLLALCLAPYSAAKPAQQGSNGQAAAEAAQSAQPATTDGTAPAAQPNAEGAPPAAPAPLSPEDHPAPAIDPADKAVQSLLKNSPFMSKAFKERLARSDTTQARELVFRGFAGNNGTWLVNIYNNKTKQAQWVKVGEQIGGITIAEFDKEGLRVKILKDATSVYLDLERYP